MSRRKTPAKRLLNHERCIATLPTACVEDRTTLSTLFMTEYTQAQLKSSLAKAHAHCTTSYIYTHQQ